MKHVVRPSQSNATNTTLIVGIPPDGSRFRCDRWANCCCAKRGNILLAQSITGFDPHGYRPVLFYK
jgi:hypothetical protein